MKKFNLSDERLVEKIYDHLKQFDKSDKLSIKVEEIDVALIVLTIEISDDFKKSEMLQYRDGIVGIPEMTENMIEYLSQQVEFFEDVEALLGSKLFSKMYRDRLDKCALGETVLDGVKYEFSFSYDTSHQCHIEIKFDRVIDGLKHESRISTDDWFDRDELEQVWSKFSKILKELSYAK